MKRQQCNSSFEPPLLRIKGLARSFAGVKVLDNVSLDLHAGEVLALMGENGAGKSTLVRILSGALQRDAGLIEIDGRPVEFHSTREAGKHGISVIYQELSLVPFLSVRDNIFLGGSDSIFSRIDSERERIVCSRLLSVLGLEADPDTPCSRLTIAQRQFVEIAKALNSRSRIIVMDEPTSSLTNEDAARLFEVIRKLRQENVGIIYISHRMDEIFTLADRITILRDGHSVFTGAISSITRDEVITFMAGRRIDQEFPRRIPNIGKSRFLVENLSRYPRVRDVSFQISEGEILGLAGLVGSGRSELAQLLFGVDRTEHGSISFDGLKLEIASPRDAINAGIVMIPEDRKRLGLSLQHSVLDNFSIAGLSRFSRHGFIRHGLIKAGFDRFKTGLNIKVSDPGMPVRTLSGGNQQKVLIARWLELDARLIILDEPTRGVDVAAKHDIYMLIQKLASKGRMILFITSDSHEALGVCDRILIMHEGRIQSEIKDVTGTSRSGILGNMLNQSQTSTASCQVAV